MMPQEASANWIESRNHMKTLWTLQTFGRFLTENVLSGVLSTIPQALMHLSQWERCSLGDMGLLDAIPRVATG